MFVDESMKNRFCDCLDALAVFANKKLKIVDGLCDSSSKYIRAKYRFKILEIVFDKHRQLIDEFVEANEPGFLHSTLDEISNWKDAVSSVFLVVEVNREHAIFSLDNYLFEVSSVNNDYKDVFNDIPTYVKAILLPFEGIVAQATTILDLQILFSKTSQKHIEEKCRNITNQNIIDDAQMFLSVAKKINIALSENASKKNKKTKTTDVIKNKICYIKPSINKHESPVKGIYGKNRYVKFEQHIKNKYADIIFDEAKETLINANWDRIEEKRKLNSYILNTANNLVDFCGIVDVDILYQQFCIWHDDVDISFDSFLEKLNLIFSYSNNMCNFVLTDPIEGEKIDIIINSSVIEYFQLMGNDNNAEALNPEVQHKNLNRFVTNLIEDHWKVDFKFFSQAAKNMNIYNYCEGIPEVQDLIQFLDERIPDEADDFEFTQNIFESFVDSYVNNLSFIDPKVFIEKLNLDFNEKEICEFENRLINAINVLPRWKNYGQSSAELLLQY